MSLVREFHLRYGAAAPTHPPLAADPALVRLRMRLIREEFKEVMDELEVLAHCATVGGTLTTYRRLLKELVDLVYVTEGTAVALGLPYDEAFKAVHASNMTKSMSTDAGGKVMKGPGYVPVDMAQLVPDAIDHE